MEMCVIWAFLMKQLNLVPCFALGEEGGWGTGRCCRSRRRRERRRA